MVWIVPGLTSWTCDASLKREITFDLLPTAVFPIVNVGGLAALEILTMIARLEDSKRKIQSIRTGALILFPLILYSSKEASTIH